MKLDAYGFDELAAEFDKMASAELTKLEREAVRKGAEVVKNNQEGNWNRSGADGEHIADNITIGNARDTEEGTAASAGVKQSLQWRAKFVEYGTSYQPPQAPVEKSRTQSEGPATDAMMNVLGRVIR